MVRYLSCRKQREGQTELTWAKTSRKSRIGGGGSSPSGGLVDDDRQYEIGDGIDEVVYAVS